MKTLAVTMLLFCSCAAYPRDQIGFWDQHVAFTGWGITFATEFGPLNLGYLQWQRNMTELEPAKPPIVRPPTN